MDLFIAIVSLLAISFTLIPLIKHDYWTFRIFDYPRLQKLTLSAICLILVIFVYQPKDTTFWLLTAGLSINIVYLLWLILPFTTLGSKQVIRASSIIDNQCISIMIANVYQDNINTDGCLEEIAKNDPDVILLLETNNFWMESTSVLKEKYPFNKLVPLENTYGMLLYSKLELKGAEVKYIVENDIPSIHTKVILRNGKPIQLFSLHPTPPVPNENPRSTERDKELLLVADLCKDCSIPVIVIGDLNDVAWSYTTQLFLKMSGLLDPRCGRGFYNSFHAHHPFMRFPLDHAFISTHFKLIDMKRLHNFDSDHFPIYIKAQYEETAALEQEAEMPDIQDIADANEKKNKDTNR